MGNVHTWYDFDWAGAEREFKRAIELSPNYPPAHGYYGWYLIAVGRTSEAVAEARKAEALDPTSVESSSVTGYWLYLAHRYDEAATQLGKCLDLDPNYIVCHWLLGNVYQQQGRFADAIAAEMKALKVEPGANWVLAKPGAPTRFRAAEPKLGARWTNCWRFPSAARSRSIRLPCNTRD